MSEQRRTITLSSGYEMPLIGLGTSRNRDEGEVETAVRAALDAGYRHIDTAFGYGNEEQIGKALKIIFEEGKYKREDLFVVNKLPSHGHRDVEKFCRMSLVALQFDYLDLYLIHSPVTAKKQDDDSKSFPVRDGKFDSDPTVNIIETWKHMETLVDKGLVRSIGLSNYNRKQIERTIDNCRIVPSVLQVECHIYLPLYELKEFCEDYDIIITGYSPLGSPGIETFFKKMFNKDVIYPNILAEPILLDIAKQCNKTAAQVALRYLIQRGIVTIPKSSNPVRIKENIEVFDFTLSDTQMKSLKSLKNGFRFFSFKELDGFGDHPEYPFDEP